MRVIRVKGNKTLQTFQLTATLYDMEATETANQKESRQEKERATLTKATTLLEKGGFEAMSPPLRDPLGVSDSGFEGDVRFAVGNGYRIRYNAEDGRLTVQGHTRWSTILPPIFAAPDCCAFVEEVRHTKTCTFIPQLKRIWLDSKKRAVLAELHISRGPDGCEVDPFYFVAHVPIDPVKGAKEQKRTAL